MNGDQLGGILRAILTTLAGFAVAKGWVDNATALSVTGGVVTVIVAVWSWWTNRPAVSGMPLSQLQK